LFSAISMNWRGRPLETHEVILQTIRATTTKTGLTVEAELDTSTYPTGIKISARQFRQVKDQALRPHEFQGEWNYSLRPDTPLKATRRETPD
jgi:hypothetical protein